MPQADLVACARTANHGRKLPFRAASGRSVGRSEHSCGNLPSRAQGLLAFAIGFGPQGQLRISIGVAERRDDRFHQRVDQVGDGRKARDARVSDLLCMSNLSHASILKEHDNNDDFQGSSRRAA